MATILENHTLHVINEDKTNERLTGVMIQVNDTESVFHVRAAKDCSIPTVIPSLRPFTGEMWSFLLGNALRCLTEEQRAGLCFDLYCRNRLTESIDKSIEMLKSER